MTDRTNWKAPCVLCGYNGPGFFQPSTHPCAAHDTERDALVAEVERLRAENERLREALADIARGDYSDPLCQRTPEQRARDALTPPTDTL